MMMHQLILCLAGASLATPLAGVTPASEKTGVRIEAVNGPVIESESGPALEREAGAWLSSLLESHRTRGREGLRDAARARGVELAPDDSLEVDLRSVEPGGFHAKDLVLLQALGFDVVRHKKHATTVRVPIERVAELPAFVPGLAHFDVPAPAVPFSGEGVIACGGQVALEKGARGAGIRIAIVDVGFIALADLIESEDLPLPVVTKNFTKTGFEETSDHGTRVAEVIHQMAPDAELVLAKVSNLSQFVDAVNWTKSQGARVVNVSLGFPGASFGDGKGQAASALDKAFDAGVIPVVAAGDFGDKHWIGEWVDLDGDSILEVLPEDADEGVTFTAQNGDAIKVYLTWDHFPKTDVDLKLQVFYVGTPRQPLPPDQTTLQATSDVVQKGNQAPLEVVSFVAKVTGDYSVVITKNGNKLPDRVQVHLSHAVTDETLRPESSIVTPGDAAKALTVAAMGVPDWLTGPARSYSGRGPTTLGGAKPDITGPDGVAGTLATPFFGTSCAAPHVAGACAVIASAQPQLLAADVKSRLLAYAEPMGDPLVFGAGRLDLTDDFFPPSPNPPEWDKVLTKASATRVTLVAKPLADDSPPVFYRFEFTGKDGIGGSGSDWQASETFEDDALLPNRQYKYRVSARDSASPENFTGVSGETKLRTQAEIPPPPEVVAITSESVTLSLPAGINPPDVELALFFVNENKWLLPTGGMKKTPTWATIATWSQILIDDLDPVSPYEFKAKARNKSGVETEFSASAFAVTAP